MISQNKQTEAELKETLRIWANIELDRLADLYKQACKKFEESIGTAIEKKTRRDAMKVFKQMEATKHAYASIGITGSIGVHYIHAVKAGE